jgi:hypothetical protein
MTAPKPGTPAHALTARELVIIKAIAASVKLLRGGSDSATPPRRLALTRAEAAEALGVSVDFLDEHVLPELRVVRRGRRRLIAVKELQRWLDENAARALDEQR